MMLLTFFATASAEFIAGRPGGDPLGCPYEHVGFVNHTFKSGSSIHTWEYLCPRNPEYKVSIVGVYERCWMDKGVLPNNVTSVLIPCCKEPYFAKRLAHCKPTRRTCHDVLCPLHMKKRVGSRSRYIGKNPPHFKRVIQMCCESTNRPRCTEGNAPQVEDCMCGENRSTPARCFNSQICTPDGSGKCEESFNTGVGAGADCGNGSSGLACLLAGETCLLKTNGNACGNAGLNACKCGVATGGNCGGSTNLACAATGSNCLLADASGPCTTSQTLTQCTCQADQTSTTEPTASSAVSALTGRMLAAIISSVVGVVLLIAICAWYVIRRGRKPADEEAHGGQDV